MQIMAITAWEIALYLLHPKIAIFQSGRTQHYNGRDICALAAPSTASRTATRNAHDGGPCTQRKASIFAVAASLAAPQTIRTLFVSKYDSYSVISDKRNDCIG
jgi:hypothetical protein